VTFDAQSGLLESVIPGDVEEPASSLLGAGSYAVVLRSATEQPATVSTASAASE
jgi:hypothetical protein